MVKIDDIIKALQTVYDPEIPVNIWDLGLIYDIDIGEDLIRIKMTFTSPTCPMMEEILDMAKNAVASVSDNKPVVIDLVWEPIWDLSKMSDTAKLELDLTEHGW